MPKVEGVVKATGRDRAEWFALLDEWRAAGRGFKEISAWLKTEHGLSQWWAQKLIVEYEQERGIRPPGVRPNGTFEVTISKTIGVPVDRLFHAIVDERERAKWLTDGGMALRTSQPGRSARFDWVDGPTRVNATFEDKGADRSTIAIGHEQLPTQDEAATAKSQWKQRLDQLKSLLES
ncbi:MAG TPA: DUF4287 domain-containing protein [Actinomycetota bacterium]|nr:DUF4287 domain-containing protein [Actinomycetota bacterium]